MCGICQPMHLKAINFRKYDQVYGKLLSCVRQGVEISVNDTPLTMNTTASAGCVTYQSYLCTINGWLLCYPYIGRLSIAFIFMALFSGNI